MKEFDPFGLPGIFQTIYDGERTGTLKVHAEDKDTYIYFLQGKVKLTTSPHKRSILAEGLMRSYEVEKDTLDAIFSKQRETKKTLLTTLREISSPNKKIKDDAFLVQICSAQINEELYELFRLPDVSCEFIEDALPEHIVDQELLQFPIALNPEAIVMEAAKRHDEWELIHQDLPSNKDIPYWNSERLGNFELGKMSAEMEKKITLSLSEIVDLEIILNKINWKKEQMIALFAHLIRTETFPNLKIKEMRKAIEALLLILEIPNIQDLLNKLRCHEFQMVQIIVELESKEKISLLREDVRRVLNIIEMTNGMRSFEEIFEQVRMSSFQALKISAALKSEMYIKLKTPAELLQMVGWEILREDNFKSIKIYERIEELGKKNFDTIKWLAKAYEKAGLTNKSLEKYRELGEISLEKNLYEEAIRAYKQVVAFAPEDLEVYEKLINVYNKNGQKEKAAEVSAIYARKVAVFDKRKAIMVLDEANKNYPSSPINLELMGMLYLDMGVKENAILTYGILATLMKKQEKLEKSLDAYRKILSIDPNHIKAHLELSKGYIELNELDQGVDQYKKLGKILYNHVLENNPNAKELVGILINVCNCIIYYEPNNIDAHEWLVDAYNMVDNPSTALNILRELLGLLQRETNLDKLVANLQKIVAMDPNDFRCRRILADTLLRQKKRNAAIHEYMYLGVKSFEKKDIKLAKEAFDAVLAVDPFNLTARQRKSDILNLLNLQAKAVEEYKLVGYLAKSVGMLPEAAEAFGQVVELSGDKELWSFLEVAKLHEQLQENDKAVYYYKQYAIRNMNRGNYGEIDSICSRILDLHPQDSEALQMKKIAEEKFALLQKCLDKLG